jgi:hypothetical protein
MDKLNGGEAARVARGEDPAMSDDRSGRHEPDETRPFSPFTDDETVAIPSGNEVEPDGGPRTGGDRATDRIEQLPRIDADGRTEQIPRAPMDDRTAMMPRDAGRTEAAARAAAGRAAPAWDTRSEPAWAGRAEVRQAQPGAGGDFTRTDWTPVGQEPRRVWWSPILIGVVVLILVAVLGAGVWLIVESGKSGTTAPAATLSAVTPAVTRPKTTPATSAAATTKPATSAPAEPENVLVPALRGLSSTDARQALERVGLTYRLKFLPSEVDPGTVIDSDPAEGQEVPSDTEVTLFIASARSSAPTTGASATPQGADVPDE